MGIFTRFKDIISSNISSMLDSAEDPEKLIRLMLREMEETLVELKSGCAATMAEAARTRKGLEEAALQVAMWEHRAELALAANRDDMAREAVEERLAAAEKAAALEAELKEYDALVSKCQEDIRLLQERIIATRDKQRLLSDRHSHARMRGKAHQAMNDADKLNSLKRFADLEQRISRMEFEADLSKPAPLTSFQDLERNAAVEEEMERIRRKLHPEA